MLSYTPYYEILENIKAGKVSPVTRVENFLERIEKEKHLNAFNFVFEDAVEKAKDIEVKIHSGSAGKLAGMVIAIKDVLSVKDKPTTCSSNILRNFKAIYSASAVQKLIEADAIIIGKTNCDEFAMGSSNENSAFGVVLNPHDNSRVPGGSSGGSAVAVAAGLCDAALGTDTGGSIRQPAAFCGVFGLKPTYGRVSRYGLTAFASSFDTIGPFANNAEDIAAVLQIISGFDEKDSTSSHLPVPEFSEELIISKSNGSLKDNSKNFEQIKIGIAEEYFGEGLNQEIRNNINEVIDWLKENGFQTVPIHLPHNEYTIAAYYVLTTAETSSNLARYDGTRYGFREFDTSSLIDMYKASRSQAFGNEVKRRIMLGTYVLSAGYYDAYYRKAQKVRRFIKEDFDKAFNEVDIILTPTSPTTAFKIGEKSNDPLQMYLSDIYTTSANLAGIPGLNIPIGKDSNGLPIGMQLLANQFVEEKLLKVSAFIQNNYLRSLK